MATEGNLNGFVMVPVPMHLVVKVMSVIASEEGVGVTAPVASATAPAPTLHTVEVADQAVTHDDRIEGRDWPEDLIRRDYRESPEPMKAILRTMAENPDTELMTADFVEPISAVYGQPKGTSSVAGILGAYGRRTKNRYKRKQWAFEAWWDDSRSGVVYRMPSRVADIIRTL